MTIVDNLTSDEESEAIRT